MLSPALLSALSLSLRLRRRFLFLTEENDWTSLSSIYLILLPDLDLQVLSSTPCSSPSPTSSIDETQRYVAFFFVSPSIDVFCIYLTSSRVNNTLRCFACSECSRMFSVPPFTVRSCSVCWRLFGVFVVTLLYKLVISVILLKSRARNRRIAFFSKGIHWCLSWAVQVWVGWEVYILPRSKAGSPILPNLWDGSEFLTSMRRFACVESTSVFDVVYCFPYLNFLGTYKEEIKNWRRRRGFIKGMLIRVNSFFISKYNLRIYNRSCCTEHVII